MSEERNYKHNAMDNQTEFNHLHIVLNELLISKRQSNDIIQLYNNRISQLKAINPHLYCTIDSLTK